MEEDIKFYLMVEDGEILGRSQSISGGDIIDVEVTEELYNDYEQGKYIYSNDEIVLNPQWEAIQLQKQNQEQINNLKQQIEELDKKRIRAICEPSIKDTTTGETWLEYYNSQIETIREQIQTLEGNN